MRLLAFVVGAASLGAEISAARLLAPYFGASTIIWANTIATVLVALSAGYALGGRLADRRADLRGLCAIVAVAGVLLAAVPFAADPFLRLAVNALGALSVGGFLGSLVAVLVLVAVPVLLLGTVAPYANRLTLGRVTQTGTVTGRLYAISTVGLAGRHVRLGAAADPVDRDPPDVPRLRALPGGGGRALVSARAGSSSSRWPSAACSPSRRPRSGAGVAGARVIFETETPYQYVRVLQFRDGVRWLQLNEGVAIHSLYRPGSYLTDGYWDDYLVAPLAGEPRRAERIAILGDAAGTIARAYGHYFPGHPRRCGRARRRADARSAGATST